MKRLIIITLLSLGMTYALTSCKDDKPEWKKFFGYTTEDILGDYVANTDESVYSDIPTNNNVVFKDATIHIQNYAKSLITLKVNFPSETMLTFHGLAPINDADYLISMKNNGYALSATVYHDELGDIRLHGFVQFGVSGDTTVYTTNYYFDVVKEE